MTAEKSSAPKLAVYARPDPVIKVRITRLYLGSYSEEWVDLSILEAARLYDDLGKALQESRDEA
jgi:hypothetical protein